MSIKPLWLHFTKTDLNTEVRQLTDEGKDLSGLQDEIDALEAADWDLPETQARFAALMDAGRELPESGLAAEEPDDLEAIRALRPATAPALGPVPDDLGDKVLGAWLGRAAGCLLGKPIEGLRSYTVYPVLEASGNMPLNRYLHSHDVAPGTWDPILSPWSRDFLVDRIDGMPEDDDMNYTTTGLAVVQQYGRDFTPENVAEFWLNTIPILRTCTAERVGYRNLVLGIDPPESAKYRNPYREWIGAQIRADFFGYCNPGNPERAAEMAWRDASVTHTRNGIYGEMWAAAMIAASFATDDPATAVRAGMAQIPANCRLAQRLEEVFCWHADGDDYVTVRERIKERFDEDDWHLWTHTITNAMIVVIGLLWGNRDYSLSICRAVEAMYDTDCNGATVGSVIGIMHGAKALPGAWIDPLQDTLTTGVKGYERVRLSEMAQKTLALIER